MSSVTLIKKILRPFLRFFVKVFSTPFIIIRMDGGICSQMHFYLIGSSISEKTGAKIKYDTNWFKKIGKDLNGKYERNFDLLKIFPHLSFEQCNSGIIHKLYFSFFFKYNTYKIEGKETENGLSSIAPPCYLEGYFNDFDNIYNRLFPQIFKVNTEVLPADNLPIMHKITGTDKGANSCAVHVRRGDLAQKNEIYGEPPTFTYYRESFRKIKDEQPEIQFFVFSDEPEWFIKEILPGLSVYDISIMDVNGSDRGWCDLILMSLCRYQITSQGSMGKYAALLRENENQSGLVILNPNPLSAEWIGRFKNARTVGG